MPALQQMTLPLAPTPPFAIGPTGLGKRLLRAEWEEHVTIIRESATPYMGRTTWQTRCSCQSGLGWTPPQGYQSRWCSRSWPLRPVQCSHYSALGHHPPTGTGVRFLPAALMLQILSSVVYKVWTVCKLWELCSQMLGSWFAFYNLKLWTNYLLGHVNIGTNLGNEVIVQRAWFSPNKEVASFRRFLMLSSTVLNSDIVPPYGCPGVPSIM